MLRQLFIVLLVLFLLALVAPADPPVNVGTVNDRAMAPTLEPGDAYLLTEPSAIEAGDVIRFWSATRGGYLTRRVVERSTDGFHTRGDASDETDQAAGLPPVHPSAVDGVVYERDGTPVTVPLLGYLVGGLRSFRVLIVGLLALFGAFAFVREERIERGPTRPVIRVRNIVLPLLAVGVVTTVAITPLGAATYQLSYAVTDDGTTSGAIPADESVQKTVSLPVAASPWRNLVVRGSGVQVQKVTVGGTNTDVTVVIPPPGETGVTRMALHVTPYPRILPDPVLGAAHDAHPILAIFAGVVTIFGPLMVLYGLLIDGRRPVTIPRWRWLRNLLDL
jgi:signal peptidase